MRTTQIAQFKRRIDRGGVYANYFSMFFTGGTFLKVFGVTGWYWYALAAVALVLMRYVAGYIEERKGILGAEQKSYFDLNPEWRSLVDKINSLTKP